jgi:hypothetical protein
VEDILHDKRIHGLFHELARKEPVRQRIDPVAEEIEDET